MFRQFLPMIVLSLLGFGAGYQSVTCKDCAPRFYRLQRACVPCPDNAYMIIVVYSVAMGKEPVAGWLYGVVGHAFWSLLLELARVHVQLSPCFMPSACNVRACFECQPR